MQMMRHLFPAHQEVAVSHVVTRGAEPDAFVPGFRVTAERLLKSVRPSVRKKEIENFRMYYHDILYCGI
jgi:hypothetical protein